jgi:hypothetical protein
MNDMNYQLSKERHEEMLRDAARDHLVRQMLSDRPHREFYGPTLARFGALLVTMGANLQAQYGESEQTRKMAITPSR